MTHDAELDRLKTIQDRTFQHKQATYQAQDQAWKRRSSARDALARAHDDKQRAYDVQTDAWQDYQRLRTNNSPRIDALNAQQETAFENMKRAFDNASSAHDRRDGASARSYADQGHAYKAESQGYVAERRRLVQAIRDARERHEATRPAFQRAKDQFDAAKRTYDAAKADHERKQAEFKRAKADFDQAVTAFRKRLEVVKATNARKKDDKRAIAQRAGVPYRYLDNVWVSRQSDGMINIYFGGVGAPNGSGHGHYVMDQQDRVVYKREPMEAHGAENFTENRREYATLTMAQMAMNQWARTQTSPRRTQYEDSEFKVDVKSGYSTKYDCITTDVLIFDKQNKREHYHLVIDDHGRELFSEWRVNH